MLSGKQFRITKSTIGIQLVNGTVKVIAVPTDGVIMVLPGPNDNGKLHDKGLVYALWDDQTIALFAIDIEARGVESHQQTTATIGQTRNSIKKSQITSGPMPSGNGHATLFPNRPNSPRIARSTRKRSFSETLSPLACIK
jgi:hypothetical protein